MKKLIALILAAVMLFALAACGAQQTAPAAESAAESAAADGEVYTYEQDMGTYTVTWTLTLNSDGSLTLDELNGRLNITTNHSGDSWSKRDDGRITTGPWSDDATVPEFAAADGTIIWELSGSSATPWVDTSGLSKLLGTYVYEEDKGDFIVKWTLTLNKDFTYALVEYHGMSGNETLHTGSEYTDDGESLVQCGPWDAKDNVSDFMAPNGACDWIVSADGTMVPAHEAEAAETAALQPGKYTFNDETPMGTSVFEVLIMGNGNCRIDVTAHDETVSHEVEGFTDLGNGYFETGALAEGQPGFEPPFFAPNGACVWHIVDAENSLIEPSTMEEAKGAGGEAKASVNPGKYLYVDEANGFTWEVLIMGNGGCRVDQYETAAYKGDGESGLVKSHECRAYENEEYCWVDNGDGSFETGEWQPEERDDAHPHDKFTSPNGVTNWKVVGDGQVEPTEKKQDFAYYGALSFKSYSEETGENWKIMIMGNGNCVIQTWDEEGHRKDEWVPRGFRTEGDDQFIIFPFEDESNLPPFMESNTMTLWHVTGEKDGNDWIVEYVGEFNPD